jgi:hypothetical protein
MMYLPRDILVMNVGSIYLVYSADGENQQES